MMTDRILSDIHDAMLLKEDAGDAIKSALFVPGRKIREQIKNKLKTAKQQEGQMIAIYRFASMQAEESL